MTCDVQRYENEMKNTNPATLPDEQEEDPVVVDAQAKSDIDIRSGCSFACD